MGIAIDFFTRERIALGEVGEQGRTLSNKKSPGSSMGMFLGMRYENRAGTAYHAFEAIIMKIGDEVRRNNRGGTDKDLDFLQRLHYLAIWGMVHTLSDTEKIKQVMRQNKKGELWSNLLNGNSEPMQLY